MSCFYLQKYRTSRADANSKSRLQELATTSSQTLSRAYRTLTPRHARTQKQRLIKLRLKDRMPTNQLQPRVQTWLSKQLTSLTQPSEASYWQADAVMPLEAHMCQAKHSMARSKLTILATIPGSLSTAVPRPVYKELCSRVLSCLSQMCSESLWTSVDHSVNVIRLSSRTASWLQPCRKPLKYVWKKQVCPGVQCEHANLLDVDLQSASSS